jgi:hypothetical protein
MHLHCALNAAYQYPNPDKSIALVPEQLIEYNKHLDRKNKNAAPEYAVWVKCPMTLTLYSPFIFFMLPSVTTSASFTLLMTTISSFLSLFFTLVLIL